MGRILPSAVSEVFFSHIHTSDHKEDHAMPHSHPAGQAAPFEHLESHVLSKHLPVSLCNDSFQWTMLEMNGTVATYITQGKALVIVRPDGLRNCDKGTRECCSALTVDHLRPPPPMLCSHFLEQTP